MSIGIFVVLNLLNGLNSGGVDNAAHFGGLLSGMALGYIFFLVLKKNPESKKMRLTDWACVAITLVTVASVYFTLPNNLKLFGEKFKSYKTNEAQASELYNFDPDFFKTPEAESIVRNGKEIWQQNLKITEEIALLDLTEPYYRKNTQMRTYAERRLQNYELMQKIAQAKDPEAYRNIFLRYNANMRWFIQELEQ